MRTATIAAPLAALLLAACGGGPAKPGGKGGDRPYPVVVAPVAATEVAYTVRAPGSIEAFESVPVAARVGGVIDRVAFREGETVGADSVLVEIDRERYRYRLAAAEADLAEAEAAVAEVRAGLERRDQLAASGQGLVSAEELGTWRARLAQAEARRAQRAAALGLARLEDGWSQVRPPVAGEVQERLVATGQRVEAGAPVATVLRRDPLLVRFRVTEAEAARLRPGMTAELGVAGRDAPATAAITHVAGAADPATRSVPVVAEIAAADAPALRPGAFAAVTVPVGSATNPAVPYAAIRPSERGFLAFVVEDGVARERVVRLGLRTADGGVEILDGLRAGESLVVRFGEALADGARVEMRPAEAATGGAE